MPTSAPTRVTFIDNTCAGRPFGPQSFRRRWRWRLVFLVERLLKWLTPC